MQLKNLVFRAAAATPLLSVIAQSEWRRRRLLILCYHGVSAQDEHEWDPRLYITKELLRDRLEWLRANRFSIVSLDSGLRHLRAGTLPQRSVAITFDDGARDFAEVAVPILQMYDAAATVYLTTYYCQHQYPVFDTALSYLLWRGRRSGADLGAELECSQSLPVAGSCQRRRAWNAAQRVARKKKLNVHGKHELLRQIACRIRVDFDAFVTSGLLQLMTPKQLRGLPRDHIDIELHTHRHRTPRERMAFHVELQENQSAIAALTQDPRVRRHFCYPNGDYDARLPLWLRERGIESAATCVPGIVAPTTDPLLLPRFTDTMSVQPECFEAWATGFAVLMPRRGARQSHTKSTA